MVLTSLGKKLQNLATHCVAQAKDPTKTIVKMGSFAFPVTLHCFQLFMLANSGFVLVKKLFSMVLCMHTMERFHVAKNEQSASPEALADWRALKTESEALVETIVGPDFELKSRSELEQCTVEEMRALYLRAQELLPVIQDELARLDVTIAPDSTQPANNQDRFTVAALASYQKFCEMVLNIEEQKTSANFAAYYPPRELGFGPQRAA